MNTIKAIGVPVIYIALVVAICVAIYVAIIAVFVALPTMLLWNWLMPMLFDLPTVTFWQAFGLYLLVAFVFGGVRTIVSKS